MKNWLILIILLMAIQMDAQASNLNIYIVDTGKYSSEIDGTYFP